MSGRRRLAAAERVVQPLVRNHLVEQGKRGRRRRSAHEELTPT